MADSSSRYRSLSAWLKARFGEPVRKITVDAGLGCPNRDGTISTGGCLYCNHRGSGTGVFSRGVSIREQVDRGIEVLSRKFRCKKFIAYFQSFTNTHAPVERLRQIYWEALFRPEIVGLAVGTRPDCVSEKVLDLMAQLAGDRLVWMEYGLQSMHARTLDLVNRGHGPEAFFSAVERTRARGIQVVAHMILGLPGESLSDMEETARAVVATGAEAVKLHPLYVIRGTGLDSMYQSGDYECLSEQAAREATMAVLEVLDPETVVHRLTSDPHAEELVAPFWMLDRRGVRSRLEKAMNERDLHQGSRHRKTGHEGK